MGYRFTKHDYCLIHNGLCSHIDYLENRILDYEERKQDTLAAVSKQYKRELEDVADKVAAHIQNYKK